MNLPGAATPAKTLAEWQRSSFGRHLRTRIGARGFGLQDRGAGKIEGLVRVPLIDDVCCVFNWKPQVETIRISKSRRRLCRKPTRNSQNLMRRPILLARYFGKFIAYVFC